MNITKSTLDYNNGRTYFQLDNLFNGDKLLGKTFLMFLKNNFYTIPECNNIVTNNVSEQATLI